MNSLEIKTLERKNSENHDVGNQTPYHSLISDETIENLEILAKLELSPKEKEQAKKDMENMLNYIHKLNELDTTEVEPMSHIFSMNNVFREDVVLNEDYREEILRNAPVQKQGSFQVPKTIS